MTDNKGLVSVIMPVYNGMPMIQASIASLLEQTYLNWECVIVNDGSTDSTRDYLASLTDARFVVHHFDKNRGRPQARQKGLECARGEFIAMLDADDIYHPEKLAVQVEVMNRHPEVYLVGAGMCSYGSNVDFIRIRNKGDGAVRLFDIKDSFPSAHAPSLLRREHAVKFSYDFNLMLGQDIDYLRRYLNGKFYTNVPRVLYYYSEFDSTTKKKIRSVYKMYAKKFFKTGEYVNSIKHVAKLIYSYVVYPFLSLNDILKKRGAEPTNHEAKEFQEYCNPKIMRLKG